MSTSSLMQHLEGYVCYLYTNYCITTVSLYYTTTANEYYEAVKLGGNEVVKKRLSLVLDRIEELKRTTQGVRGLMQDLPIPPSNTGLIVNAVSAHLPTTNITASASASIGTQSAAAQAPSKPVGQHLGGTSSKFSHDELAVLTASSRINGRLFLPW